jgi:hypothetical protein
VLMWRLFLSCRFCNFGIRVELQSVLLEAHKAMLKAPGKVAIVSTIKVASVFVELCPTF